jgi:hypothetical protein
LPGVLGGFRPLVLIVSLMLAVAGCTAPDATWNEARPSGSTTTPAPTTPPPFQGWSDPAGVGQPYGSKPDGLLTFRGNPTRTFYGTGPAVRANPTQRWSFPKDGPMCGTTKVYGKEQTWCGNGWTGQPNVIERDGRTWIITGGYDHHVHFLDATTGDRIIPDFVTGDLVKGTLALDPDGYPLVYTGSRDGFFRIISYDDAEPKELWRLDGNTVQPKYADDDWDSSGLIIDDYLFQNSENGNFHIIKINRGYDSAGKVTVAPKLLYHIPSWDAELQKVDSDFSVENSVAIYNNVAYFANSSGLVQGWDLSGLKAGNKPTRVFASGPATTPTPPSPSTSRACSTSGSNGTRRTRARARSARYSSSIRPNRTIPLCGTPSTRLAIWAESSARPPSTRTSSSSTPTTAT